jgi:hypothetical protein
MTSSQHDEILSVYRQLGWSVVSGDMWWNPEKKSKDFKHHGSWKSNPVLRPGSSGYALRTGAVSGITAIDVDDLSIEENRRLSELCEGAGAIKQVTRRGCHYVFRYTPHLPHCAGTGGVKLDVRNDGGILYCEPSSYVPDGSQRMRYHWQNLPLSPETIPECPQDIIDAVIKILGEGRSQHTATPQERKKRETERKTNNRRATVELAKTGLDLPAADETVLRTLLHGIDVSHATNYQDWITVGLALHHAGAAWELFDEFSQRVPEKHVDGEPFYVFSRFGHRGEEERVVTLATLYWWLKQENPSVFQELFASEMRSEYERLKVAFEKNNFYVDQHLCHVDDRGCLKPFQPSSARCYYANLNVKHFDGKRVKETDFLSLWYKDENRKAYERVDFYPDESKCPPHVYNTFKGFEAAKLTFDLSEEEIDRLVAPILELTDAISGGHPSFFLSWLADILQNPGRKPELAVVQRDRTQRLFEAGGGTGKTYFLTWFGNKVLGRDYFIVVTNNSDLYDPFSELFENRLLVCVEETDGRVNNKNLDYLKALITCLSRSMNKKQVPKYTVRDLCRYIFTSNHANPIPGYGATPSDRRFWFTDVHTRRRGDVRYWNDLAAHMERPEVACAFYRYLLRHPTWETPADFCAHRPVTTATTHIRFLNSGPIIQWLVHRIQHELPLEGSVATLFADFEQWVADEQPERNERPHRITKKYFKEQLTENEDIMGGHQPGHISYRTNQDGHLRLDRELVRKKLLQNHYMLPNPQDVRDLLLAPQSPVSPMRRASRSDPAEPRRSSKSAPPKTGRGRVAST